MARNSDAGPPLPPPLTPQPNHDAAATTTSICTTPQPPLTSPLLSKRRLHYILPYATTARSPYHNCNKIKIIEIQLLLLLLIRSFSLHCSFVYLCYAVYGDPETETRASRFNVYTPHGLSLYSRPYHCEQFLLHYPPSSFRTVPSPVRYPFVYLFLFLPIRTFLFHFTATNSSRLVLVVPGSSSRQSSVHYHSPLLTLPIVSALTLGENCCRSHTVRRCRLPALFFCYTLLLSSPHSVVTIILTRSRKCFHS